MEPPKLHPVLCNSVGMRPRTDTRHTDAKCNNWTANRSSSHSSTKSTRPPNLLICCITSSLFNLVAAWTCSSSLVTFCSRSTYIILVTNKSTDHSFRPAPYFCRSTASLSLYPWLVCSCHIVLFLFSTLVNHNSLTVLLPSFPRILPTVTQFILRH